MARWAGSHFNIDFKSPTVGNSSDWVPPGWDLWYAFTGTRAGYYNYAINENGNILDFGDEPHDYSTHVLKDRAVRFILKQSESKRPFFLFIAPKAPHAEGKQAIPSPKYEQAFNNEKLPVGPAFDEKSVKHKAMKPPRLDEVAKRELELGYRASLQSLQSSMTSLRRWLMRWRVAAGRPTP